MVIVTLGLGLVFGETAIGALVGMISLGGAVWLFYLRRQNELGDATLRQEKERRLAYTLILARLRRYRDRVSYLDSYLKGARLFDANADDIAVVARAQGLNADGIKRQYIQGLAPHIEAVAWPENLDLTADDARHLDAEDIAGLERFRLNATNYLRQIDVATQNRDQPLVGFSGTCVKGILERLDALILQFSPKSGEAIATVHGMPQGDKTST